MNIEPTLLALAATLGVAASALGLAHVKAKASSVLIHHASHNNLLPDNLPLNRHAAQAVGVMTLNADLDAYFLGADRQTGHRGHHGKKLASLDDEEGAFISVQGFAPGMSKTALWRLHWRTVLSPVFHAHMAAGRLAANFLRGSRRRRAVAWLYWGAVLGGAAAAGWLLPLVLTLATGLIVGGQVASWYELLSRHRWLINTGTSGLAHQAALSQGRYLGAMPPALSAGIATWTRFAGATLAALAGRFLCIQCDLPNHQHHHLGLDRSAKTGMHSWTDSAQAQLPQVWQQTPVERGRVFNTLHGAIDCWFDALSRQAPVARSEQAPAAPPQQTPAAPSQTKPADAHNKHTR